MTLNCWHSQPFATNAIDRVPACRLLLHFRFASGMESKIDTLALNRSKAEPGTEAEKHRHYGYSSSKQTKKKTPSKVIFGRERP